MPHVKPVRVGAAVLRTRWKSLPGFVRYLVAGSATQVVYLSTLGLVLMTPTHYMVGLAVAQVVAMAFAFPVYRGLVFARSGNVLRQLLAFAGVWWTGTAMSVVGVPLLVESLGIAPFLAQILVLCVVLVWSFLGHTRVTFRQRRSVAL